MADILVISKWRWWIEISSIAEAMNQNVFNTSATKEISMDWKKTETTYNLKMLRRRKIPCFMEELRLLSELRSPLRGKSSFSWWVQTLLLTALISCSLAQQNPSLACNFGRLRKRSSQPLSRALLKNNDLYQTHGNQQFSLLVCFVYQWHAGLNNTRAILEFTARIFLG